ncbi:hypothetical protein EX30DRAFT_162605 [Ascodesmis nigricans]|uniref:Fe2OG dioxygenase domain-containing protein n=1 Tax=Ascodesmis nigricans TaxID=341454 RepID=A0A4S2MMG3_9PEZI|nr:hypothetical protein EX30DRAFT_162605 [Ascodesmis nigricans]
MDGQIIISHCGGKSAEVDDSNERALIDDQFKDDNPVRCMLNNWQYKQPIVMIMGSKCPTSPTKMPHRYQVLDWFMITHAWTEPDPFSGHVRFKYRFEKVGLQESSWWAPQGMPGKNEEYLPAVAIEERECATCNKKSPRIYEEGFLCIHSTCQQFWKLDGQSAAHNLHYTQQFLRARHPVPPNYVVPSPLAPSIDGLLLDRNAELGNAHRDFWKGIVCPACGNCCARTSWKGWVCTCGYSREVGFHVTYTASQLREPHRDRYVGAPIPAINNRYNIPVKVETNGATTIVRYDLGPAVGTVIHVQNSDELNKKLGMDELLQRYQDPELPFKRGQVTTMCGTSYTRNFALNCGAAYHYVVDQDTVKMEDAPVVVQNVLSMLNEQVGKLCPGHRDFNEVLSLAYLEDMRMNYHTDDEVGLGPVVASLSLGAPARMGFRFRAGWKQNKLCHFPGLDVDDVKSGIPQFSVTLNHGDLLIMDGAGIQRYWEHSLTRVEGLFRIAATGRYIDPDTHEAASRPFGPTPAQRMAITSPKSETTVPTGEAQSTYMEDFFTHLHSIPKKEKSRRKSAVPTASATS